MLNTFPVAFLIGAVLGFLAGLGLGGGSLLILWLTSVVAMDYPTARALNLLFFLPAAGISSIQRWKQGKLPLKKILPAILSGCVSASIFSYVGRYIDLHILKKLFGILLLATGLRELFYRPRNAK